MADNNVRYDVDGYSVITTALRDLVNQYPALDLSDSITYGVLNADSGKAMFPTGSGAVIENERISVTGRVRQICGYPFCVVYRASGLSENRKAAVKEWLDNLGRWLERQEITVGDISYKLNEYPDLTGERKFTAIERTSPAFLESVEENNAENWVIYLTARYQNEYYRK